MDVYGYVVLSVLTENLNVFIACGKMFAFVFEIFHYPSILGQFPQISFA